jgi:glycosyltransferase 2 family protein
MSTAGSAGQAVQALLTVVILLVLPSPVRPVMPYVAAAVAVALLAVALLVKGRSTGNRSVAARVRTALARDIRDALLAGRAWLPIALASLLVVAGHAIAFVIAARTAGADAPLSVMIPLALLAMTGMVLPSAGGWGPREGVTAWAFGAAGLGAQRGVTTAVVYGVMVFVACLPGAAVLIVAWFRRIRLPQRSQPQLRESAVHA